MAGASFGGPLLICLLKFILNKKSSSHSLQFPLKYHVFLNSLWLQIWEHTHHNSGPVAIYYTAVELEKNVTYGIRKNITYREQRTDRQRTEKAITEATLILWITGLSGPILMNNIISYSKTYFNKDMT